MAKVKFDVQKVKELIFSKGERLGLAVALVLMVLLVLYGSWTAMSASPLHEAISQAATQLESKIASANPTDIDYPASDVKAPDWKKLDNPDKFLGVGWYQPGAVGDNKRRNPVILPIGNLVSDKIKQIQVDLLRMPVLTFDLDLERKKVRVLSTGAATGAAEGAQPPVALAKPKRFVVVSAEFPYKDQLDLFRKALRKDYVKDLFDPKESPIRFLGLNVQRCEVLANGKQGPWEELYSTDKDGKVVIKNREVQNLLIEARYDEENIVELGDWIFQGLVSPRPMLAYGKYPPLELSEVGKLPEVASDDGTGTTAAKPPMAVPSPAIGMPGKGVALPGAAPAPGAAAETGVEINVVAVDLKKMPPAVKELFANRFPPGEIYPFDPFGTMPDKVEDPNLAGLPGSPLAPPARPIAGAGGAATTRKAPLPNAAKDPIQEKCLVRFLDVDVQPGKTYQYSVQVRMANPNYGRKQDVISKDLAEIKELLSPWTLTPRVSVPGEFEFYVVDQYLIDPAKRSLLRPADFKDRDRTGVQIQRWVDTFRDVNGNLRTIGDWAIAERLLVQRGEYLAREKVEVEIPEWNPLRGRFELGSSVAPPRGPAPKGPKPPVPPPSSGKAGVSVDFVPRAASLCVDFVGGSHPYEIPKASTIADEAAVEMLIQSPEGKLLVRNSRDDADAEARKIHYLTWRNRVEELKGLAQPGGPAGGGPQIKLPGSGGG